MFQRFFGFKPPSPPLSEQEKAYRISDSMAIAIGRGYEIDKLTDAIAKGANVNESSTFELNSFERIKDPAPPLLRAIFRASDTLPQYVVAAMALLIDHGADVNYNYTSGSEKIPFLAFAHNADRDTVIVQRILLLHGSDYMEEKVTEGISSKIRFTSGRPPSYNQKALDKALNEMDRVKARDANASAAVEAGDKALKAENSEEAAVHYTEAAKNHQENAAYYTEQAEEFYKLHREFFLSDQVQRNSHYKEDKSPLIHRGIIAHGLKHIEQAIIYGRCASNQQLAAALGQKAAMLSLIDDHHVNTPDVNKHRAEIASLMKEASTLTLPSELRTHDGSLPVPPSPSRFTRRDSPSHSSNSGRSDNTPTDSEQSPLLAQILHQKYVARPHSPSFAEKEQAAVERMSLLAHNDDSESITSHTQSTLTRRRNNRPAVPTH